MDTATLGGALTLGRSILQVASEIQNLADEWFTVTEEYESNVESLRIQIDFYGQEMDRNGVPIDQSMVKALQRAAKWLKREELKVKELNNSINSGQCCAMGWWLYAKVTMIAFPQKLEKTLKRVTDEIDKITKNLQMETEMDDHLRKWRDRRAPPLTFHNNDGLYVSMKESQEQVERAIERFPSWSIDLDRSDRLGDHMSDSEQVDKAIEKLTSWQPQRSYLRERWSDPAWWPCIILLHGGVGQGKSALARYVYALYEKDGKKGNVFEHVIYLPCGNCNIPDRVKKQFEVLKLLSPSSCQSGSLQESDSEARIEATLRDFLTGKKVLIILDDVSDQTFLHKMWAAAQGSHHVKYLVTSRMLDLCSSLTENSCAIQMGDPTQNEARTILANHAGFGDSKIPPHLKEIADEMIKVTEGNPLALACLTRNFTNGQDRRNKRAWQEALRALHSLLDKPVKKLVFGHTHESAWASMKQCIGALTDEASAILLLMYACQGQSIPEEVLRLLYSATKKASFTFFPSIGELSTRNLLKESPSTLALGKDEMEEYIQESRAWSLPSLVKIYLDWDMADKVGNEDRTSEIVSAEESPLKTRLRNVIRDLLGDDAIASEEDVVKGKLEPQIEGDTISSKKSAVKGKQLESQIEGDAIESEEGTVTGKLESQLGVNREKRVITVLCALYFDQGSARTALSLYPDHPRTFDEVVAFAARRAWTVSKLRGSIDTTNQLRRRKAIQPIIWLLDRLQAEDGKLTRRVTHLVRQVFLKYVCEGQLDHANICILLNSCKASYPPAPLALLTTIAYIFSQEETPLLKEAHVTFLTTIVRLLEPEGVRRSIREAASEALFHISKKATERGTSVGVIKIIPEMLAVLVRSIEDSLAKPAGATLDCADHDPLLPQHAKRALTRYAGGKSMKYQILAVRQESIQHQEPVTRQILAGGGESVELQTSNEGGALAGLDSMMDHNPILLQNVVGTLMNLAAGPDSVKRQISNENGALGRLVKCLCHDRNPSVQENAAGVFMELALGSEPVRSNILDEDGALAGLVRSLSKQSNPILQARSAATLQDLAFGGDLPIWKIANAEGALTGLVQSLSKDQNLGLQANAAGALQNLASGDEKVKLKILDEHGALVGLVNALSKHHNGILQEKAAGTLRNLATVGESSKPRILIQDGAIAGLVRCLFMDNNSALQQTAAEALLNLAGGGESIKLQILKEEQVLEGLVKSLSKNGNVVLQEKAAGALSNLARGGDSIKSKIVNENRALSSLVESLSEDSKPLLQETAAGALVNLAAGNELIKRKIVTKYSVVLGLVKALCKAHNPCLQVNAVGALMNLSLGEEETKLRILNVDKALVAILKYLSDRHHHPTVKVYANGTLNCLANTEGYSNMFNMSDEDMLLQEAFKKFEATCRNTSSSADRPEDWRVRPLNPQ